MLHKMSKYQKPDKYRALLYEIGKSEQGLTKYELSAGGTNDGGTRRMSFGNYAYDMIEVLLGKPSESINLDDPRYSSRRLADDPELNREFYRKLKKAMPSPQFLTGPEDGGVDKKYFITFRGFLLYLFLEGKAIRPDERRIYKVLSNSTIIKLAPFLQSWQDFKRAGFPVASVLDKMSESWQDLLDHDEEYLLHLVTREYYLKVARYFDDYGSFSDELVTQELKSEIDKYHESMLTLLETYAVADLNSIRSAIEHRYGLERKHQQLNKELADFINH